MQKSKFSNTLIGLTSILTVTFLLINMMIHHYELIYFPYQIEYREGASLLLSKAFLSNKHPYTLESLPLLQDVYGFINPLISSLFIKFFGTDLSSVRLLSGVSIFLSVVFFLYYNTKLNEKKSKLMLYFFCVFFYAFNLFSVIPTARPDALGYLFFIIALSLPKLNHFNRKSLLISILFSILAFYTKIYLIIAFPLVLSYIFLFQSMKRAIKYFLLFFSTLILSLFIIHIPFNNYFLSTFSGSFFAVSYDMIHLCKQLIFYFIDLNFLVSLILLIIVLKKLTSVQTNIQNFIMSLPLSIFIYFNFLNIKDAFIKSNRKINYDGFMLIMGMLLLILKLGGHTGQFGVYFIQLLSFSMLSYILSVFNSNMNHFYILIVSISVFSVYKAYKIIPIQSNDSAKKKFDKIERLISTKNEVLASPSLASILIKQNKVAYNSGLTENIYTTIRFSENRALPKIVAKIKDKLLLENIYKIKMIGEKYLNSIEKKVRNKK